MRTLTVPQHQIDSGAAVSGPKHIAMEAFRASGVVLWLRARGTATLFYRDSKGKARQASWASFRIAR